MGGGERLPQSRPPGSPVSILNYDLDRITSCRLWLGSSMIHQNKSLYLPAAPPSREKEACLL